MYVWYTKYICCLAQVQQSIYKLSKAHQHTIRSFINDNETWHSDFDLYVTYLGVHRLLLSLCCLQWIYEGEVLWLLFFWSYLVHGLKLLLSEKTNGIPRIRKKLLFYNLISNQIIYRSVCDCIDPNKYVHISKFTLKWSSRSNVYYQNNNDNISPHS